MKEDATPKNVNNPNGPPITTLSKKEIVTPNNDLASYLLIFITTFL